MLQLQTFHFALPIGRRDDGCLVADLDAALEFQSPERAVWAAEAMAKAPGYVAAWAFTRTGDPACGHWLPAESLKRFGDIELRWSSDMQTFTG
jgi:hypothetical protein